MLKYVVCLCKGGDGCCVFCLYHGLWGCRCSCMASMSVSSCRCCMIVSCMHPVAVLNVAFCCHLSYLLDAAPKSNCCRHKTCCITKKSYSVGGVKHFTDPKSTIYPPSTYLPIHKVLVLVIWPYTEATNSAANVWAFPWLGPKSTNSWWCVLLHAVQITTCDPSFTCAMTQVLAWRFWQPSKH